MKKKKLKFSNRATAHRLGACAQGYSYSAAIFIFQKFHTLTVYNIMGKGKLTSIMC